jgi:hypothetical protein
MTKEEQGILGKLEQAQNLYQDAKIEIVNCKDSAALLEIVERTEGSFGVYSVLSDLQTNLKNYFNRKDKK